MSCPMKKDVPLTDAEVKRFCSEGCSIDCDKILDNYMRNKKKREHRTEVEHNGPEII